MDDSKVKHKQLGTWYFLLTVPVAYLFGFAGFVNIAILLVIYGTVMMMAIDGV